MNPLFETRRGMMSFPPRGMTRKSRLRSARPGPGAQDRAGTLPPSYSPTPLLPVCITPVACYHSSELPSRHRVCALTPQPPPRCLLLAGSLGLVLGCSGVSVSQSPAVPAPTVLLLQYTHPPPPNPVVWLREICFSPTWFQQNIPHSHSGNLPSSPSALVARASFFGLKLPPPPHVCLTTIVRSRRLTRWRCRGEG